MIGHVNDEKIYKKIFWIVIGFLILLIPILLYIYRFSSNGLSSNHQRWAEFGSYIGGIYSAILTGLVILVLIRQTNAQIGINKHQIDQTNIQRAEKDLEYYIAQLCSYLSTTSTGIETLRNVILNKYGKLTKEQLLEDTTKKDASAIHYQHPIILDVWSAIYPILIGLNKVKELPYELSFSSSRKKVLSILSVDICIGIDHLYFCFSNDAWNGNYFFSKEIDKRVKEKSNSL